MFFVVFCGLNDDAVSDARKHGLFYYCDKAFDGGDDVHVVAVSSEQDFSHKCTDANLVDGRLYYIADFVSDESGNLLFDVRLNLFSESPFTKVLREHLFGDVGGVKVDSECREWQKDDVHIVVFKQKQHCNLANIHKCLHNYVDFA